MTNVYPSTEELIPEVFQAMLPASLVKEITERYETLGFKYVSGEKLSEDGRLVNDMMYTSRIDNCLEEIVDATFCILGQIFKDSVVNKPSSDNLYTVLQSLIDIYSLLKMESINEKN